MMQVPVTMNMAWDWLVNTQTGADIFAEKLAMARNKVADEQRAHPGLRDLTGIELENYALGLYGGFEKRYYTSDEKDSQWQWQTTTRPDLLDYVSSIRKSIRQ